MTPEEKLQLERVDQKLSQFLDVYYRTHFIDKDVFQNPVVFNNKIAFYNTTPVNQPDTVADPSGGATQDAEARTAIDAIIDRLQELGLIA